MLPLLQLLSDQKEHSIQEAVEDISQRFHLTEQERKELLPSGAKTIVYDRTGWARTYLKKAGLLEPTRRSFFKVTPRGLDVLQERPDSISVEYLERFPEFVEFKSLKRETRTKALEPRTPQELLEAGYEALTADIAQQILDRIAKSPHEFFENLVVDLLLKMGYGGSRKDAGRAIGKTRDEGIDGTIEQDILGLDTIYIQAKRWEGTVGRPEIHKFVGALQGQRAKKGIFITTSSFSEDAKTYVGQIDPKVILIDGERLAGLMISHNIGVSTEATYEVKKIDSDYFPE